MFYFLYKIHLINFYLNLINQIRKIAILTKYTTDIRRGFLNGIAKAKADDLLNKNYNKKVIPLGKLFIPFYYNKANIL